jgi:hypothetical protein
MEVEAIPVDLVDVCEFNESMMVGSVLAVSSR